MVSFFLLLIHSYHDLRKHKIHCIVWIGLDFLDYFVLLLFDSHITFPYDINVEYGIDLIELDGSFYILSNFDSFIT